MPWCVGRYGGATAYLSVGDSHTESRAEVWKARGGWGCCLLFCLSVALAGWLAAVCLCSWCFSIIEI